MESLHAVEINCFAFDLSQRLDARLQQLLGTQLRTLCRSVSHMRIHLMPPNGQKPRVPTQSFRCNRNLNLNRRHALACLTFIGVCGFVGWVLLMLSTQSDQLHWNLRRMKSQQAGLSISRIGSIAAVAQPSVSESASVIWPEQPTSCGTNLSAWEPGQHPPTCWSRPRPIGMQLARETTKWDTTTDAGRIARRECVQRHLFAAHGLDTLQEYFMQGDIMSRLS